MSWIIWDCQTGSVDGFYQHKKDAKHVFKSLQEQGCTTIMLCKVCKKSEHSRIPNHLFHARNGIGFYGRSQ